LAWSDRRPVMEGALGPTIIVLSSFLFYEPLCRQKRGHS
jgi:hypothetical protein